MRLHRFYVGKDTELKHSFWLHDAALMRQWLKVLRYQPGQEVVLFDGVASERLYKITELTERQAHLELITEFERKLPTKNVYLLWSLLKKDKNEWVLQKGTELGVRHFVPLLADRSEKTGFKLERAEKIVIEAAEQCGRSDVPLVREPLLVSTAIDELKPKMSLFVCEQSSSSNEYESVDTLGVLIGPEGGWSDKEKQLFTNSNLQHLSLHTFTLRAETAAVIASAKLLQ